MPPSQRQVVKALPSGASDRLEGFVERHTVGSSIWAEDEKLVWAPARVVSQKGTILTIRYEETGVEQDMDLSFTEVYPQNPKVVADMTALYHINEPGIMHNLSERVKLENQHPYTFMGTLLICVNPLRRISEPRFEEFMDHPLDPEKPHPYAIAEMAYNQMKLASSGCVDQSIVVSGESGAGKTETSKIILKYLAGRTKGGVDGLDSRVIESSPILESFGNAKTLRNPNSSRFGKFLKLQFTKDSADLVGGFMDTYLLEKSRVLSQAPGERNFHILYEMVAGLDQSLKDKFGLTKAENYRILSQGGCLTLDGIDDARQFRGVANAFNTIGLSEELQEQVWAMLAAVLHVACIEFQEIETSEGFVASIFQPEIQAIGMLLGVDYIQLNNMLTKRSVKTHGETFIKSNNMGEAAYARDACAKALYECVFLWVVKTVSDSLGVEDRNLPSIGVLDIFGFENFIRNELEQLLINYTNESLQDLFNKQVFINEISLYEREGIKVSVSSCPDNSECIKLLCGKPNGIISLLDSMCREPEPSDARFCSALHTKHRKDQNFPAVHKKDMKDSFMVKHYAGRVKYTVEGWIVRNNDRIPDEFQMVLESSNLEAVQGAAAIIKVVPPPVQFLKPVTKSKPALKPTVAKGFMDSMAQLSLVLEATTCSFVRCIKPNFEMEVGRYDNKYVVDQLQCLGILQTCEVLKVGLPTRITYSELKLVLKEHVEEAEKIFAGEPETALIAAVLWSFDIPSDSFKLGNTRVFFKAGQISTLENILRNATAEKGAVIVDRLHQALADRLAAKVEAESAERLLASIEASLDPAVTALHSATRAAKNQLSTAMIAEIHELRQVLARTKKTSAAHLSNIEKLLDACKADGLGKHAPKAAEILKVAADDATDKATQASDAAEKLEAALQSAQLDGSEKLADQLQDTLAALKRLKLQMNTAVAACVDAANKCQAAPAKEKHLLAQELAARITESSDTAMKSCVAASNAAEHQRQALAQASSTSASCNMLVDAANVAYEHVRTVAVKAQGDENQAALAAAKAKERERRANKAKREAEALAALSVPSSPSDIPKIGTHGRTSTLTQFLSTGLPTDATELMDDSDKTDNNSPLKNATNNILVERKPLPVKLSRGQSVKHAAGSLSVGSDGEITVIKPKTFSVLFEEALLAGKIEGHLMKQSKFLNRWKSRFCVLEDGYLTYYDKKSYVGTNKKKSTRIMASTVTSYTNTRNCFCVRSEDEVWFLLAKDEESMMRWMTAINANVHQMYLQNYTVPADNYWRPEYPRMRAFYQMVQESAPQWIRTYPELDAPRTGDGLFPGEIIEVVQCLGSPTHAVFLRLADDRGWTFLRHPQTTTILFEEIGGDIVEDTKVYGFLASASESVAILFGPGIDSQQTGEVLEPGEKVKACERFIPSGDSDVVFIKLADGRGWMPVRRKNDSQSLQATH